MTNTSTNTTTVPSTSTRSRSSRRRRFNAAVAVTGLAFVGLAACASDDSVTTEEPAAVVSRAVRPAMSPDALTRWAEAPVPAPATSPDAAERWAEAERLEQVEQQDRIDEAACRRMSQGLASC